MFIKAIDITSIDSAECMCRALRCLAIDSFDPSNVRVVLDDVDPHESPDCQGTSFTIEDQGGDDYRVTVSFADAPRPVQLGESSRAILDLAKQIGADHARGLLTAFAEGRLVALDIVVTEPDGSRKVASTVYRHRDDVGTAGDDEPAEEEAVRRLFPDAAGDDEGPCDGPLTTPHPAEC